MNAFTWFLLIAFVWTLISFLAGVIVHWLATRGQRELLKAYEDREAAHEAWQASMQPIRGRRRRPKK